jgi:hypothetical protein
MSDEKLPTLPGHHTRRVDGGAVEFVREVPIEVVQREVAALKQEVDALTREVAALQATIERLVRSGLPVGAYKAPNET